MYVTTNAGVEWATPCTVPNAVSLSSDQVLCSIPMVFRIKAPHFVAGCHDGECAPIIRYMENWPIERIRSYCASKGWILEIHTSNGTRELNSRKTGLEIQGAQMNGFGNNSDYSNIFTGIAKAKSMGGGGRSEEHTSELQSPCNLVCRLLLEKKK